MSDNTYGWQVLPPLERMPLAVAALWKLGPEGLEQFIMNNTWFVEPDDLVGGWCIVPLPHPPSTGNIEIGGFTHRGVAQHVADLHNERLLTELTKGEPV